MSASPLSVVQIQHGAATPHEDVLAQEVAVALVYNGLSHVVLMATPQDLAELATGFSLTEGILASVSELYDIEIEAQPLGHVVHLDIAAGAFMRLKDRRRSMSGRTGCGLCGLDNLEAVRPNLPPVALSGSLRHASIVRALNAFDAQQPLRAQTGSVHGAAWVNPDGDIVCVFEDVGRHNALDKLGGWRARQPFEEGFVLVSSRASFEMVVKTAMLGAACLVAVSAPTAYAVQLANDIGMTLVAFARPSRQLVYSHPERLVY